MANAYREQAEKLGNLGKPANVHDHSRQGTGGPNQRAPGKYFDRFFALCDDFWK